jgi:hypothetical protein
MESMEGCSVALKISHFAKELLASLLSDSNPSTTTQNDQALLESTPRFLLNDGAAFFPGFPEDSQTGYATFNFFEEGLLDFALQ